MRASTFYIFPVLASFISYGVCQGYNKQDFQPSRTVNPRSSIPANSFRRFISNNCSVYQQHLERQAWAESGLLFDAIEEWAAQSPDAQSAHQDVMDIYMGTDSGVSSNQGGQMRHSMFDAIDKLRKLRSGELPDVEVYVHCNETYFPDSFFTQPGCDSARRTCCSNETNTYSWTDHSGSKEMHSVVLCPRFAANPTLSEQVRYLKESDYMPYVNDSNKLYGNIGSTYFQNMLVWASAIDTNSTASPALAASSTGQHVATTLGTSISKSTGQPSSSQSPTLKAPVAESNTYIRPRAAADMSHTTTAAAHVSTDRGTAHSSKSMTSSKSSTSSTVSAPGTHKNQSSTSANDIGPSAPKIATSVDCVSGNPACAVELAKVKNVAGTISNPDSWAIAAGVIYTNITAVPMPGISEASYQHVNASVAYQGPTSKFFGAISTPWVLSSGKSSGSGAGMWANSTDTVLRTQDYANYTTGLQSIPTPSCISLPYIAVSPEEKFENETIYNDFCTSDQVKTGVQPTEPYLPSAYEFPLGGTSDEMVLWLSISLAQHPELGGYIMLQDDCTQWFRQILLGCSSNDNLAKYSGSLVYGGYILDVQTGMRGDPPPKGLLAESASGWYGY